LVEHLYPDFLKDPAQYQLAERYWRDMVEDIATDHRQRGEWQPFLVRFFRNGTPMPRDGNPIYDARSERLLRALQIIQWPPDSRDHAAISAWLDSFDHSADGGTGPTDELFINLVLSKESAVRARELIERWMSPETSFEEMEMVAKSVGG